MKSDENYLVHLHTFLLFVYKFIWAFLYHKFAAHLIGYCFNYSVYNLQVQLYYFPFGLETSVIQFVVDLGNYYLLYYYHMCGMMIILYLLNGNLLYKCCVHNKLCDMHESIFVMWLLFAGKQRLALADTSP